MTRFRHLLLERGLLLGVVMTAIYLFLAPHHVVDGDNAEFATLSVTGGSAHPSGYPLYVLWLRLMSWLPAASPAHSAAMATALLGGASVLVLHAACRAWGASNVAANMSVAVFASGPVVLRVVSEAEVFALNNLVVATVVWLAATDAPLRGLWRAAALGLVAGLGLANHLTCVLVAPVGIVGVIRGGHERGTPRGVAWALLVASAGLVMGLTPYLYLMIAPDTQMAWKKVDGLGGIVDMFLRRDYGGPTAFSPGEQTVSPIGNLGALARTMGRAWLYVPAAVGIASLVICCVRGAARVGWWMLAATWLLCGPLLVMRFNVPSEGIGLYVTQRFHLMPTLLLALPVAAALTRVELRRATLVNALVSTVLPLGLAASSLGYVGRVHSPAVETSAKNLLLSMPRDAIVIHGQDELHAVTGYAQWALGLRQDVRIVTWPLMKMRWYQHRMAERGVWSAHSAGSPLVQLVRYQRLKGTPVFIDRLQREVIENFPTHPYGVLLRVVPAGSPVPTVQEVAAMNEELFAAFALDYPKPGLDDEFATEVHRRYSATWAMIAAMLDRSGDTAGAAKARNRADKLAPQ